MPPPKGNFWPFKKARAYVRKLGLRTSTEWLEYCQFGDKPDFLPCNPNIYYRDTGWGGYRDWLADTRGLVKGRYLSFKRARQFARGLGFKSVMSWHEYAGSGTKPGNIPSHPEAVYKNIGWVDYADWLKLERSTKGGYLPYEQAKEWVHTLQLATKSEWVDYTRTHRLPKNIPKDPYTTYRYQGYISMSDWLGSDTPGSRTRQFWSFRKARSWVRKHNLQTVDDWWTLARSGELPHEIPRTPQHVYSTHWKGFPDWIGNANQSVQRYRPDRNIKETRGFVTARRFVRRLGLEGKQEWLDYTRSGECPLDIPSDPAKAYRDVGWVSMSDWLGNHKK